LAFFAQTTANFLNNYHNIVFEKNADFCCRKLAKIAKNVIISSTPWGVIAVITIFGDLGQFSAKQLAALVIFLSTLANRAYSLTKNVVMFTLADRCAAYQQKFVYNSFGVVQN
jgi:hypothetical protein